MAQKIQIDAFILIVRNLRHLENLNLESCQLNDRAVFQLAKHCSKLSHLSLAGYHILSLNYKYACRCSNLGNESISALAEGIPSLTSLNLNSLSKLTDRTVYKLVLFTPPPPWY